MDPLDRLFARYAASGDPETLGAVFDRTAPRLLPLALHLAGAPDDAEDLLQLTFLTAIEKAGSWDRTRPLLPWLSGILTRHARKLAERRARRPDRSRLRERTPAADPARSAEFAELLELLRTGLDELPDHQRRVLLLQLVHGLAPAEIAEVIGVPPATVRTRLHRGLRQLRRSLPAGVAVPALAVTSSLRGMGAVRQTVLQHAALRHAALQHAALPHAAPPSSLIAAGGSLIMMKKILAAVAVLVSILVLWQGWPLADGAAEPVAGAGAAGELRVPAAASPPATGTAVEGQRERVPRVAEARRTTGVLRVVVRRATTGSPLGQVGVFVHPLDGSDPGFSTQWTATDAAGVAQFERVPAGPVRVLLDRGADDSVVVAAGRTTAHTMTISPGVTVRGEVVSALDAPVPHAAIWIQLNTVSRPSVIVGHADARGQFELLDVRANVSMVGASAAPLAPSYHVSVRGEPGTVQTVKLRLGDRGARVHGLVVDRRGAPVPGAVVAVGDRYGAHVVREGGTTSHPWPPYRVRTGEQGEFAVDGVATGFVQVFVRAAGHAAYTEHVELQPGEERFVRVELRDGLTVRGRVVDPDGGPVVGAHVWAAGLASFERVAATSTGDGAFVLAGVNPDYAEVRVRAAGFAEYRCVLRVPVPGADAVRHDVRHDVHLGRVPVLRGRVVDEHGAPLPGFQLRWTGRWRPATVADGAGRFTLAAPVTGESWPPPAPALSLAEPESRVWFACDWVRIPAREGDVEIRVPAAARPRAFVTGRVLDATGRVVEGAHVTAQGRSCHVAAPVDAAGRFRLGPLPAGEYALDIAVPGARIGPRVGPFSVQNGEEKVLGDVRVQRPGVVRVRLRRTGGEAVVGASIFFWDAAGREVVGFRMQRDGTGRDRLPPGRYRYRVLTSNSEWRSGHCKVESGAETRIDLELAPAMRRYITFPVPVPDWGEPRRVVYVLRDAQGRELDRDDFDPREDAPFRYMPAFGVGEYTLELSTDTGRRFVGAFHVADLHPSYRPIVVSVDPR